MNHIPKYLKLYEVLPRDTYYSLEASGKLDTWGWRLFDPRILWTADRLRTLYGKMLCNTWFWEGQHQFRGWRPGDARVGATYSQHKFGRALDLVFDISVYDIRRDIKANKWPVMFQYITCIEDGVGWLHIDCRNYDGLLIVKP
jgi:hypothetical protein